MPTAAGRVIFKEGDDVIGAREDADVRRVCDSDFGPAVDEACDLFGRSVSSYQEIGIYSVGKNNVRPLLFRVKIQVSVERVPPDILGPVLRVDEFRKSVTIAAVDVVKFEKHLNRIR